jgi:hypothetical protein
VTYRDGSQRRFLRIIRIPERVLSRPRVIALSPFLARIASLTLPSSQSSNGTPIASAAHRINRLRKNNHIAVHLLALISLQVSVTNGFRASRVV